MPNATEAVIARHADALRYMASDMFTWQPGFLIRPAADLEALVEAGIVKASDSRASVRLTADGLEMVQAM